MHCTSEGTGRILGQERERIDREAVVGKLTGIAREGYRQEDDKGQYQEDTY